MIKVSQFMDIRKLHKNGVSIKQIATTTGHSRNTVRKVLRGEHEMKALPVVRSSKLDDFKPHLTERYREFGLSAVRLIEEIRPMGYSGSVQTVRRFLATLKAGEARQKRLTVRFETPPGHQAQVDWKECGKHAGADGVLVPVYAFVMVMAYSRMLFVRFTTSMKMGVLLDCHRRAFDFFGGIPDEILYDNMKQVRTGPGKLNATLVDFAAHHAFTAKTHRAYRPRTKGKVERPNHYLDHNFLAGRSFEGLDDLNARGKHWLNHTANVRVHGTTKERPIDLFEKERGLLTPIADVRPYHFIDPVTRVVSYESMIRFDGSAYSVPPCHAGKTVHVAADGGQIVVRVDDAIVAEHRQAVGRGACVVNPDHMAELWKLSQQQTPLPDDAKRWSITFDQSVATTPLATFEEVAI